MWKGQVLGEDSAGTEKSAFAGSFMSATMRMILSFETLSEMEVDFVPAEL